MVESSPKVEYNYEVETALPPPLLDDQAPPAPLVIPE